MDNSILLSLTGIGLLGISCQWLAWAVRLPAILFLLTVGILIGPVSGWLQPDQLFGDLLFPMVSLSVAVILFEGSLTLRLNEIRGLAHVVRNLVSIGAFVSWIITAVATHYLIGLPYQLAFLFSAVVVVTGPTVIMPILRTVRPNAKIANVLRWEGIVIDPLGALLAVLVFNFIVSGQYEDAIGAIMLVFIKTVINGFAIGCLTAYFLGIILRRHLIPEYLRNVFTLVVVFGAFTLADFLVHESGLLTVTVMGMVLANLPDTDIDDILDFKESLSLLLISGLFIILAARIDFSQLLAMGWPALAVVSIIMFLARPLAVMLSALGSDLSLREVALISWIGPRGIVAAAVAALFALRLESVGVAAAFLVPLTFLVIICTVVLQSLTAKRLAILLGVREPPPQGVLLIGAGNLARALGGALQAHGFPVLLADSHWDNIRLARMQGLPTYYGNPVSEHADRNLVLVGLGKIVTMSGRADLDTLACMRFRREFRANDVYSLQTSHEHSIAEKHTISGRHKGAQLFGDEISYGCLASWLRLGAEIKSTSLGDNFDFEQYLENYTDRCIPLFAIDNKQHLQFFVAEDKLHPQVDWEVVSLILPEGQSLESA